MAIDIVLVLIVLYIAIQLVVIIHGSLPCKNLVTFVTTVAVKSQVGFFTSNARQNQKVYHFHST